MWAVVQPLDRDPDTRKRVFLYGNCQARMAGDRGLMEPVYCRTQSLIRSMVETLSFS